MRFFENQDRARRNTLLLIALFSLALTLIVLAVSLLVWLITSFTSDPRPFQQWLLAREGLINVAVVVAVILSVSLYRYTDLADGGEKVAEMVGARPIPANTSDIDETRLRHITEEMAIATGIAPPRLYVMDGEQGINAFVAGYQPGEAVMVITRGALEQLNRDELQGVVGHEFSHILNGDMRINVRLIALLAGILFIGQMGQSMVQLGSWGHGRRFSRRRDSRGGAVFVGLALMLIGYIGLFFGRLIKAAVSRQREYLADAAAVQFTRNSQGIGGALYKIGIASDGSRLRTTSHAEAMNHLCFGESVHLAFGRFLASHPTIEARLGAIDPDLEARMRARYGRQLTDPHDSVTPAPDTPATSGFAPLAAHGTVDPSREAGTVSAENDDYARNLLANLPGGLYQQLHQPDGAVHLCFALAVEAFDHERISQTLSTLAPVGNIEPDELWVRQLQQTLHELGPAYRLPLLELALAALRELDTKAREQLLDDMERLLRDDGRISLSEYALLSFLRKHLTAGAARATRVRFRRYAPVLDDIRTLLWLMARACNSDNPTPLFEQAMAGFENPPRQPSRKNINAQSLVRSLQRLNALTPMLKPAILDACCHCALHDDRIATREYELLRIIADQLDCPLPPLPVTRNKQ